MNPTLPATLSGTHSTSFREAHLASAELRRQHIESLEDRITELSAHIHAATFRLLELIREYDECKGWAGPGLLSLAHWLNWKCGIDMGAAREKVRVAHALKGLPQISAAFREGHISYSKVRAMTRVATVKNEEYLLMIAAHGTAAHVERLVRNYRMVKRIEALEQESTRHAQRELSWYVDDDGYWVVKGRFTLEQGAVIQKVLEGVMDESFREQRDVSAETSDEALADEINAHPEPIMLRRADALVRMAQGYQPAQATCSGGDRFLVHVHADMETLKADGAGAEAELEGIGNVPAETARRLTCDAGIVHWLESGEGNESGGNEAVGSHHAGHALNYWPLSAIPGFRGTGASLHIGRSQPSLAFAAPVHPCTLAAKPAAFPQQSAAPCSAAMAVVVSRVAPAHALSMLTTSSIGPMGVKLR